MKWFACNIHSGLLLVLLVAGTSCRKEKVDQNCRLSRITEKHFDIFNGYFQTTDIFYNSKGQIDYLLVKVGSNFRNRIQYQYQNDQLVTLLYFLKDTSTTPEFTEQLSYDEENRLIHIRESPGNNSANFTYFGDSVALTAENNYFYRSAKNNAAGDALIEYHFLNNGAQLIEKVDYQRSHLENPYYYIRKPKTWVGGIDLGQAYTSWLTKKAISSMTSGNGQYFNDSDIKLNSSGKIRKMTHILVEYEFSYACP